MPTATIGRIVHYVIKSGACRPAQVLAAWDQESGKPLLNLVVTLDGMNDRDEEPAHTHRLRAEDGQSATFGGPPALQVHRTSVAHADPFEPDAAVQPRLVPETWHWPEGMDQA